VADLGEGWTELKPGIKWPAKKSASSGPFSMLYQ